MLRRLFSSSSFVSCGFAAGMVLTGRMRTAEEAGASADAAGRPPRCGARPRIAGLPDLSAIASRAIGDVMNIANLVNRSCDAPNSPFCRDPFFR